MSFATLYLINASVASTAWFDIEAAGWQFMLPLVAAGLGVVTPLFGMTMLRSIRGEDYDALTPFGRYQGRVNISAAVAMFASSVLASLLLGNMVMSILVTAVALVVITLIFMAVLHTPLRNEWKKEFHREDAVTKRT